MKGMLMALMIAEVVVAVAGFVEGIVVEDSLVVVLVLTSFAAEVAVEVASCWDAILGV